MVNAVKISTDYMVSVSAPGKSKHYQIYELESSLISLKELEWFESEKLKENEKIEKEKENLRRVEAEIPPIEKLLKEASKEKEAILNEWTQLKSENDQLLEEEAAYLRFVNALEKDPSELKLEIETLWSELKELQQ